MTIKSQVPQIRFQGFDKIWNKDEIGNLADITAGGTPNTSNPSYWNPKQIPWMSSGEINKKRLFSTDNQISELGLNNSSAKWIKNNSVLIALAGQGKTRGTVAVNYIPLTTNQSIAAIIPNDKLYYEFLYQNLESRYEELRMESSGDGTRGGLNKQIISQISILFPEMNEQTKIGNYFQQLDKLVVQKQMKHQKLKQFKKAMLDKMFPKDGADTPEVRFKGFSGKWEEKSLDEIVDRYDNLRVPISASNRIAGSTPYYGANGIQDYVKGFTHYGEFILVAEDGANDLKNYPVQYVNGKIWVNNHAHVLQAKKDIASNKFLKYAISKINIEPFLVGGGRAKLNANIMMKIVIYVPSNLKEQTKIGNYFKKLDTQIELQLQELEKLKNIKKALLDKMFI